MRKAFHIWVIALGMTKKITGGIKPLRKEKGRRAGNQAVHLMVSK